MTAIVFQGGTIATGSERGDSAKLHVIDGRVAGLGEQVPADAEIIDLAGSYLGPAFGDGHAHLLQAGREGSGPEIRSATSVDDIVASVRAWAVAHPESEWIVGASYQSTLAPDGRFDARWLDEAVADRPIVLRAWDYHTAWCNSLALERAAITAETPDPEDGIIARRPDGSPLGTLIESGATNRVLDLIPPTTVEIAVEELRRSTAYAASCGITWVQDAWVDAGDIEAWVTAAHQGVLAVDADLAIRADPTRWAELCAELPTLRQRIDQAPGITCRTLKFFIDGIVENHTAYLLENYADRCTRGLPVWRADQLLAAFVDADRLGFDLHVHAIGDGSVRLALDAVQNLRTVTGDGGPRVTLAHAQLIDQADIKRFAALDLTVCFQPLWAAEDAVMRELTLPRLGPGRALQYRMRSVLDAGARLSFGSDWPVTSPNVLAGIRTAVTRQAPDGLPAGGWQSAERITVTEALTAATRGVAYQARAEEFRGHLGPGAQADLVWLSADPRAVPPAELARVEVRGTWRRGRRTY